MKWATRALSHPKIIWSIYCKDAIAITNIRAAPISSVKCEIGADFYFWVAPSWGRVVGEVLVFFAEEVDEHGGVGHVEQTVVVEVACFQGHVAITQNRIDEGCYV